MKRLEELADIQCELVSKEVTGGVVYRHLVIPEPNPEGSIKGLKIEFGVKVVNKEFDSLPKSLSYKQAIELSLGRDGMSLDGMKIIQQDCNAEDLLNAMIHRLQSLK